MSDSRDENLLFGILALQLDFITQEQLVAAANSWMVAKSSGLDEILVKLGVLSQDDREFVKQIVRKHVSRSGSPHRSLDMLKQHETVSVTESQVQSALSNLTCEDTNRRPVKPDATTVWTPPDNSADSRFLRLRDLASGGLGVVSVARDQELDREVALKEMLSHKRFSADAYERFVAEAKITGNLEHPGIVPIYGLGSTANGSPYYAMRLIRGRSLHEEIAILQGSEDSRQSKRISFADLDAEHFRNLLRSLTVACYAVAYAHSRGVIHRDLKPGNIMLGKFGETIVVDWGLAKVTGDAEQSQMRSEPAVRDSRDSSDSETVMGSVLGTPGYMSPEQADGRIDLVDRRSDVFGLGACLYALLTNRAPFKGSSKAETIANARSHRFQPLREIDHTIPRAIEAICMKAMAADPNKRYQQATELAQDIDRWIAGEAVTAMPDPVLQRLFRWARRHQTLVSSTAVLLVTTLLGLAVASYLIREQRDIARRERDRANEAAAEAQAQREKADTALVKSRESNAVSLKVLSTFVDGLGDNGWAAVPQMESKRTEMVDLAVARFRKLHEDNLDDVEIRVQFIRALVRSANVYRMVAKLDKSSELFGEVMKLVETLNDEELKQVGLSVAGDTLYSYTNLVEDKFGSLAAILPCTQGIEICRKRIQIEPAAPMAKLGLLMALNQLAGLQLDIGKPEEALGNAGEAQSLLRSVSKTSLAKQFFYPLFDIISRNLQTKALLELQRFDEAQAMIADTAETCNSAKQRFPAENNIAYFSIKNDRNAATLALKKDDFDAGVKMFLGVIEATEKLAASYPETAEYQRSLLLLNAELGIEWFLHDDIEKAQHYATIAMKEVDIANLTPESALSDMKADLPSIALTLALALHTGQNPNQDTSQLQQTASMLYERIQSATPNCYTLRVVESIPGLIAALEREP